MGFEHLIEEIRAHILRQWEIKVIHPKLYFIIRADKDPEKFRRELKKAESLKVLDLFTPYEPKEAIVPEHPVRSERIKRHKKKSSKKDELRKSSVFDKKSKKRVVIEEPPEKKGVVDPNIGLTVMTGERYQIIKKLGSGAFGSVYLAKATKEDEKIQEVAVKVFSKEKRFEYMIETALYNTVEERKLDKNVVVEMYGFGSLEEPHGYYIVQEKMDMDLAKFAKTISLGLAREHHEIYKDIRALKSSEVYRNFNARVDEVMKQIHIMFSDLVRNLALLHSVGIYHSDIKPENILIKALKEEGKFIAKFGDLGLSCYEDPMERKAVNICSSALFEGSSGTQTYLPPEYFLGERMTEVEFKRYYDAWALGLTFLQVVYGYFYLVYVPKFDDPSNPKYVTAFNQYVNEKFIEGGGYGFLLDPKAEIKILDPLTYEVKDEKVANYIGIVRESGHFREIMKICEQLLHPDPKERVKFVDNSLSL